MENTSLTPTARPTNGQSKTAMLSSNSTLFWKLFVPIFGSSCLTGMLIALWSSATTESTLSRPVILGIQISFTFFWIFWLLFIRRTLWRLLRIDANETHIYVTNYWTTARYPWSDIERIEEKNKLGKRVVNFHLKDNGYFGQILSFLPGSSYDVWKSEKKLPQALPN